MRSFEIHFYEKHTGKWKNTGYVQKAWTAKQAENLYRRKSGLYGGDSLDVVAKPVRHS